MGINEVEVKLKKYYAEDGKETENVDIVRN